MPTGASAPLFGDKVRFTGIGAGRYTGGMVELMHILGTVCVSIPIMRG